MFLSSQRILKVIKRWRLTLMFFTKGGRKFMTKIKNRKSLTDLHQCTVESRTVDLATKDWCTLICTIHSGKTLLRLVQITVDQSNFPFKEGWKSLGVVLNKTFFCSQLYGNGCEAILFRIWCRVETFGAFSSQKQLIAKFFCVYC